MVAHPKRTGRRAGFGLQLGRPLDDEAGAWAAGPGFSALLRHPQQPKRHDHRRSRVVAVIVIMSSRGLPRFRCHDHVEEGGGAGVEGEEGRWTGTPARPKT